MIIKIDADANVTVEGKDETKPATRPCGCADRQDCTRCNPNWYGQAAVAAVRTLEPSAAMIAPFHAWHPVTMACAECKALTYVKPGRWERCECGSTHHWNN